MVVTIGSARLSNVDGVGIRSAGCSVAGREENLKRQSFPIATRGGRLLARGEALAAECEVNLPKLWAAILANATFLT